MGFLDEFKWVNFFLNHHNPFDFHMPRWISFHPVFLVITRGIFAVYCISILILGIIVGIEPGLAKNTPKWLIYATSWNYMIITLYFMLGFGICFTQAPMDCRHGHSKKSPESIPINIPEKDNYSSKSKKNADDEDKNIEAKLPLKLKIFWVVFNVAINVSTLVVIGYWGLVHDYRKKMEFKLVSYLIVDRHGINFALMVIDFFLHKIPYRILHFIYPVIIGIAYIIFNVVYWSITGDGIYKFVNWNKSTGKTIGASIGLIILMVVLQLIWYWIHRFKKRLAKHKSTKSLYVDAADI